MKKLPILFVGIPGIGKTAKIRAKYDHCEVLLLSSQTEEDIAGIPYREGENEKRTTPPWLQRIKSAKGTRCLFLDEIDKARREVADTLLTLITHQEYFGLPEDVDIVAAANPPEWGGGDGLSQPMINRFAVVEAVADFEGWKTYIENKYGKNEFLERLIEKISDKQIPFLEHNGDGLNFRLTCPRTLDMAITACYQGTPELLTGLLTPNAASGILSLWNNNFSTKEMQVQEISRSIGSKKITSIYRTK